MEEPKEKSLSEFIEKAAAEIDHQDIADEIELQLQEVQEKQKWQSGVWSWVKTLGLAVILALCINSFIVVNAEVQSGSMESTIMTGDRVMCNRLVYLFGQPQRYDIIVFNFEESNGETVKYVKRVIGLPGETVEVIEGQVYINGSDTPLVDSFVNDGWEPEDQLYENYGPYEVPEGHYFVMGDNRFASYDSRKWPYPYVPQQDILGKAFWVYYPSMHLIRTAE